MHISLIKKNLWVLLFIIGISVSASSAFAADVTKTRGESATLYWSITGASDCTATIPANTGSTIDYTTWSGLKSAVNGTVGETFGPLTVVGTFSLMCEALGVSDTKIIEVLACPAGTTWNGSNACTCDNYPAGGNYPTCNTCPGGYTWTNDGSNGGTGSCQVSSCGNGAIDPPTCTPLPTVNLTSGAPKVSYNTATTLTWTTGSSPTSCTASLGWSGSKNIAGDTQSTGNLTATTTFNIQCSNAGGSSVVSSVTVGVCTAAMPNWNGTNCLPLGPVAPVITLVPDNANLSLNGSTNLNWTTSNSPTTCTGSGDWSGSKALGGGVEGTGALSSTQTYVLTCSNAGGSGHATATVAVCTGGTPNWNGSSCVAVPSGTVTYGGGSGGTCTIAVGASRCGKTIDWSVTNPVLGTSSLTDTASGTISTANSGSIFVWNAPGENTNTLTLMHNSVTLDTKTVVSSCIVNSHWDAATTTPQCVLDDPSGTIDAAPLLCTILANQSTCRTTITWSTINTTDASVIQDINFFSGELSSSSPATNAVITFGGSTFWLKDDNSTTTLDSVLADAACIAGTTWDAGTTTPRCVPNALPPGAACPISSMPSICTIAFDASVCTTNITWTPSVEVVSPNIRAGIQDSGNPILMSGNGGQFSTGNLTMGDVQYYTCFDNLTPVQVSNPLTVQCAADSTWDAGTTTPRCVPDPHTAIPDFSGVATGNTSINLSWDCNTKWANSVRITRTPSGSFTTLNTTTTVDLPDPIGGLVADTDYNYTLFCYEGLNGAGTPTGNASLDLRTYNDSLTPTGCSNGADPTSAPACDSCPAGEIFDGIQCTTLGIGSMCGQAFPRYPSGDQSLLTRVCGDGVVDAGESCDGLVGIASSTLQLCSNDCSTITCKNGGTGPGCGLDASAVCTNGALQTSAPGCAVCPSGQIIDVINNICITPICGNGVQETGEQCDDFNQSTLLSSSGQCTYGCCTSTTTPSQCFPTFNLSCSAPVTTFSVWEVSPGNSAVLGPKAYAPESWTPTTAGTYELRCVHGSNVGISTVTVTGACNVPSQPATLSATPRSVKRGGTTSLTWGIDTPDQTCKLIAMPIITAPTPTCDADCFADRIKDASNISNQLNRGLTDSNSVGGSRPMYTALTTEFNGKAQGKKSVKVKYTTVFQASCGLNPVLDPRTVKAIVKVSEDREG